MNGPGLGPEEATKDLVAWEIDVEGDLAMGFFDTITKEAKAAGADVLVLRSDMIFGLDHLRSALYHAMTSFLEGTNSSDSLAMETLLYASGERQLNSAIRKMSVDASTRRIVVARLQGDFRPRPGWKELEARASDISKERLIRFGVTEQELSTVRDGQDLVLEKVAAVDVLKR